ncbi:DUF2274 domain-containing protein [Serratia marcescens]|nr:DUF2274 domain-containing protein [Serratia marcescens]
MCWVFVKCLVIFQESNGRKLLRCMPIFIRLDSGSTPQAYGETVDAATLIPYMLEAFMPGDRGFKKGGQATPKPVPR